jgi:D-3-phosphoglycerate dehydrogenase / 2-oxoglutarate reductase
MSKILCLNNISPVGLQTLPNAYSITKELSEAKAILVRSFAMHELALPENILAVARAGAGVNNIPVDTYAKQGVVVFNTPGANANAVKELTIASMLLAVRDISGGIQWIKENKQDKEIAKTVEKAKAAFAGTEIFGKSVGIVGLGAVGALIAGACAGLGMQVFGIDASPEVIEKNKHLFPANIHLCESIDEIYQHADFISLNIPLIPPTKGMINKDSIAKMKDGVIILNLARDAIVNDLDMKEALLSKKVRKYVTDFPNELTANMEGVLAIPHLGASTEEAEDNCAIMAARQIVSFLETGSIINSVNYPNVEVAPCEDFARMIVLHENIDQLASQVVSMVEEYATISQMITKSRNAYGVTIIDFSKPKKGCPEDGCLRDKVDAIAGIIRVRVIHN